MAAYGQVIENGGSEEEALTFVEDMLAQHRRPGRQRA